jgi:hypothetical protein
MNNLGPHSKWHNLEHFHMEDLNKAIMICHQAAQLIAMTGKHLIPAKKDDSHTSMTYKKGLSLLLGGKIAGKQAMRVALDIRTLNLMILTDKLEMLAEFNLNGKYLIEGFDFLKSELLSLGADTSKMNMKMHYSLPYQSLADIEIEMFSAPAFKQHALLRENAELMLRFFSDIFINTDKVRVWPHHFDTGIILYKRKNSSGQHITTVGAGFSMADEMIDQPYFYINYWSGNGITKSSNFPTLEHGEWGKEGWNGASLKIQELYNYSDPEEQVNMLSKFYSTAVEHAIEMLPV